MVFKKLFQGILVAFILISFFTAISLSTSTVTVSISASPSSGPTPLTVSFKAQGSLASSFGCPTATYDWDFGDSQSGNGPIPSHTYIKAGSYTATVTYTAQFKDPATLICSPSAATNSTPITANPAPAYFKIVHCDGPAGAYVGDVMSFKVDVQNTGGETDTRNVNLEIDGFPANFSQNLSSSMTLNVLQTDTGTFQVLASAHNSTGFESYTVSMSPANNSGQPVSECDLKVNGLGFRPSLEVAPFFIIFDLAQLPLGNASLSSSSAAGREALYVNNIGKSGHDGVAINLADQGKNVDSLLVTMTSPGSQQQPPSPAGIVVEDFKGDLVALNPQPLPPAGTPPSFDVSFQPCPKPPCDLTSLNPQPLPPGQFMLFSDFSALGSRPVTLEIYQGDKLVGKTSSTGGNAMIQFADPTQELKQQVLMALTMQNAGCLPSIEFNWDSSHAPQIQLPGSSQPESATKLRLIGGDSLLGDPDCKGTAFSSEGLTAGGISEFEITREQVHRL